MSEPVAVASIELSEEQRRRIAAELGLGADELDAVPATLGVAKYEVTEESDDEVGGFSFNPAGMTFSPVRVTPDGVTHTQTVVGGLSSVAKIGRSPGFILVPV